MGEDGGGAGGLRPEQLRLVKIAIVAVIVIVALVIAVPFIQEALRQPTITLTDRTVFRTTCGLFGSSQTYRFVFTLVNSGDADGFANVQFFIDSTNRANNNYFIPAGSSVDKDATVVVGDCVGHSTDIRLESTWKA